MQNTSFKEISYEKHSEFYKEQNVEALLKKHKTFFEVKTVDLWRHTRQLELIKLYCGIYKNSEWLTVGDGGFGSSATYIEMHGGKVISTDLDTSLLKIAAENKLITSFQYANAENLPFEEAQFDFSFCKQSYHHFPRPIIAVYEMLRVSKKAVMLVEPADWLPSPFVLRTLQRLKRKLKQLAGLKNPHHEEGSFEPVGNYIYTISEREIEKIAMGIALPCIAFKRFDDFYYKGVETEMIEKNGPLNKKIKKMLAINTLKRHLGLVTKNNIMCILFKYSPDTNERAMLKLNGFDVIDLPKNPYA
ncbi:MAG: class I SAM-dependent methyltransferase [Bacteroidia bacterium]|nr:class I SAM-dependent methyltransferase [Bacteroidia bacterium]